MGIQIASGWFGGRPAAAAAQLREALELGFEGLGLLPGDPAPELEGLPGARKETGLSFSAADWGVLQSRAGRAAVRSAPAGPEELAAAFRAIPPVLADLQALGAGVLIVRAGPDAGEGLAARGQRVLGRLRAGEALDTGDEAVEQLLTLDLQPESLLRRERQVEGLARFLHGLHQAAPGLRVALAPEANPVCLLTPALAGHLLEDSSLPGLGVWFGVGVAEARSRLGLEEPGAWLDAFGPRLLGATLEDYAQGRDGLPPGEGEADLRLVAEYLPRAAVKVLSLAPAYPGEAVLEARTALEALGIR